MLGGLDYSQIGSSKKRRIEQDEQMVDLRTIKEEMMGLQMSGKPKAQDDTDQYFD